MNLVLLDTELKPDPEKITKYMNHKGFNKRWSFFYPIYKVINSFGVLCQDMS